MNKRAFVQLIQLSFVGKSSGFFFRLEIGNPASFKFPVSGLIMCECFLVVITAGERCWRWPNSGLAVEQSPQTAQSHRRVCATF